MPIEVFHFRAYVTDTEPIPARGSPEDGQCTKNKFEKSEIEEKTKSVIIRFLFIVIQCATTTFSIQLIENLLLIYSKNFHVND